MKSAIVHDSRPITLVGGGKVKKSLLEAAIVHAPQMVAADGAADTVLALGWMPDAVIGDFDSLSAAGQAAIPFTRLHPIDEQDSTDFEKCLARVRAPLVLAVGFLGARLDHQLAALTAITACSRPVVLLGAEDIAFALPPEISLALPPDSRFSLYPLAPVTGRSKGLEWPIDGLTFTPAGRIGTSNRVTGPVHLQMDAPGMVAITPPEALDAVIAALTAAPAR